MGQKIIMVVEGIGIAFRGFNATYLCSYFTKMLKRG